MQRLMALALSFLTTAAVASSTAAVQVRFEKAFIPLTFDTNDRSQVVLTGVYPDTCYQGGGVQYQVDKAARVIRATQWAFYQPGNCLPATVPFSSVLTFDRLEAGIYEIEDAASGTKLGELAITLAKGPLVPGASYANFAPVSDAYIEQNATTRQTELVLTGTWTDRCTHFKEVKLFYQSDVLVVQPIVEPLNEEDSRDCALQIDRFQKRVPIQTMGERTFLLHVQTPGGFAINKIYND